MSFDKDAFKRDLKDKLNPRKAFTKEGITAAHQIDPGNIARTGKTASKKAKEKQSLLLERQSQREEIRLAESDDEIARRRALAKGKKGGRRSLIKTSEAGTGATTLGGG